MKFSSACKSLAFSSLVTAAHVHHGSGHHNVKRDVGVVTITDIVWDVVTVTEYDLPAAAATTAAAVAAVETTVVAPVVQTTSTKTPAAVPTTTNSPAANPQAEEVTVAVVAPTTSAAAAAVVNTPTTTSQAVVAQSSASATSGEYSGDGTFYELGLTACGQTYTDSDYVAAISYLLFDQDGTANPNNNPHCGKKITVYRDGKSVDVTIVDRCAGCENMYSVDLSPVAFNVLGTPAEGRIPITWSYT